MHGLGKIDLPAGYAKSGASAQNLVTVHACQGRKGSEGGEEREREEKNAEWRDKLQIELRREGEDARKIEGRDGGE
jgi:hypothetical protein